MNARLLLAASCLFAGAADAADFSLQGFGDVSLIVPATQGSYYYGDLGKLRYGYDDGSVTARLSEIVAEARVQLAPELMLTATGRVDPYYGPIADLIETYARYRPVSTSAWRWSVKAGAFFPPVSLENTQIGWTSPWTITPSAINSWVGYELRTIGTEGTLAWRDAERTIAITTAVFGWNDPAGVLIADRGWSFDDRASGLFERERLPDALGALRHTAPPFHTELFQEIDGKPGWYARGAWTEPGVGEFSLIRYDNEADPSAQRNGIFAWRTKFWNAGASTQFDNLTLLAQALSGSTEIETSPARRSITHFSSAYVLAGLDFDDWRLAARFDTFRTHNAMGSLMSENGTAGTLAANWFPVSWLQLTGELIVLGSARAERSLVGEQVADTERQFQLMARFFF
ncbi:MAG TPA: hypothetical protein VKB71_03560 [Rhizomicrobium sp.]|nr:hypothetical protein [Rhizomicrobium sp.]